MSNTSPSITLPVEPRPKRPTALSPLIGYGTNVDEKQAGEAPFLDEKLFYYSQPQTTPSPTYLPPYSAVAGASEEAYTKFLEDYPQYLKTTIVDGLRQSEYTRLKRSGETYVDYTGGGLYPEKLPKAHLEFLNTNVLGNTHSVNNSSQSSMRTVCEAHATVLDFFGASKEDYTVVFTSNATGALKLVGEAFPFKKGSSYVLSTDSHNSVNGIRQFAIEKGADLVYIPTTKVGGMDSNVAKDLLSQHKPQSNETPSLFILTAQSNATNSKGDLSLIQYAASLGYYTMLDAAAFVPCTPISLSKVGADAMCVSFYKMFGYPTGLGALVVKKKVLMDVLHRPWFGGGTVDLVQAPRTVVTRALTPNERFEDGTGNYASMKAITNGLNFLAEYQPYLSLRISCIMRYMWTAVPTILHDSGSQEPVAKIVSREPGPALQNVGEHSETGTIIALLFYGPEGELLPLSFIEFAAAQNKISLRTGCVCNPGGVAAMIGIQNEMTHLCQDMTRKQWEADLQREVGMVRVSFGLASNFHDAWAVTQFIATIGRKKDREALWKKWTDSQLEQDAEVKFFMDS